MKVNSAFLQVSSANPGKLVEFYEKVVGLQRNPDAGDHSFHIGGGASMGFDQHDAIGATTKEPARAFVSLFVDDVAAEEARIEGQGVKFIRKQGKEFWGGIISTFVDPDGNYCQIIEYRPE